MPKPNPAPNPPRSAAALLVATIEATGGVAQQSDGTYTPVGDEDWVDLADAYLAACRELDRKPMVAK